MLQNQPVASMAVQGVVHRERPPVHVKDTLPDGKTSRSGSSRMRSRSESPVKRSPSRSRSPVGRSKPRRRSRSPTKRVESSHSRSKTPPRNRSRTPKISRARSRTPSRSERPRKRSPTPRVHAWTHRHKGSPSNTRSMSRSPRRRSPRARSRSPRRRSPRARSRSPRRRSPRARSRSPRPRSPRARSRSRSPRPRLRLVARSRSRSPRRRSPRAYSRREQSPSQLCKRSRSKERERLPTYGYPRKSLTRSRSRSRDGSKRRKPSKSRIRSPAHGSSKKRPHSSAHTNDKSSKHDRDNRMMDDSTKEKGDGSKLGKDDVKEDEIVIGKNDLKKDEIVIGKDDLKKDEIVVIDKDDPKKDKIVVIDLTKKHNKHDSKKDDVTMITEVDSAAQDKDDRKNDGNKTQPGSSGAAAKNRPVPNYELAANRFTVVANAKALPAPNSRGPAMTQSGDAKSQTQSKAKPSPKAVGAAKDVGAAKAASVAKTPRAAKAASAVKMNPRAKLMRALISKKVPTLKDFNFKGMGLKLNAVKIGLQGIELDLAIAARDWPMMKKIVVTMPKPDRRHIWILGDLQVYLAAQQANSYGPYGSSLQLPKTQLVWLGIPGLQLSKVTQAIRQQLRKLPKFLPYLLLLHVGTEDMACKLDRATAEWTTIDMLRTLRQLLPDTIIVWSEQIVTAPMSVEVKAAAGHLNQVAHNTLQKVMHHTGFLENNSVFSGTDDVLFRHDKTYFNDYGAFQLAMHYRNFLVAMFDQK